MKKHIFCLILMLSISTLIGVAMQPTKRSTDEISGGFIEGFNETKRSKTTYASEDVSQETNNLLEKIDSLLAEFSSFSGNTADKVFLYCRALELKHQTEYFIHADNYSSTISDKYKILLNQIDIIQKQSIENDTANNDDRDEEFDLVEILDLCMLDTPNLGGAIYELINNLNSIRKLTPQDFITNILYNYIVIEKKHIDGRIGVQAIINCMNSMCAEGFAKFANSRGIIEKLDLEPFDTHFLNKTQVISIISNHFNITFDAAECANCNLLDYELFQFYAFICNDLVDEYNISQKAFYIKLIQSFLKLLIINGAMPDYIFEQDVYAPVQKIFLSLVAEIKAGKKFSINSFPQLSKFNKLTY